MGGVLGGSKRRIKLPDRKNSRLLLEPFFQISLQPTAVEAPNNEGDFEDNFPFGRGW